MKSCLVIDDSTVVRKVARRIFEDLQFSVSEAGDGDEALEMCVARMPDMILVDWKMPNIDGVEFLSSLRAMSAGKAPTVVYCASENDVGQIARALRAGADDYLLKPFDRGMVEPKVREIGLI
jgi:two-component system chemotaxis response regulator CheY